MASPVGPLDIGWGKPCRPSRCGPCKHGPRLCEYFHPLAEEIYKEREMPQDNEDDDTVPVGYIWAYRRTPHRGDSRM